MTEFHQPQESSEIPSAVMDYITLAAMARAAEKSVEGSRVRRVMALSPWDVVIAFDPASSLDVTPLFHTWLFSFHPVLFRVHPWLDPLPDRPFRSHLAEVMSHHLSGARAVKIALEKFERVFSIEFSRRDPSGEEFNYRFIAELMGKHSNLIFVDSQNRILACGKSVHSYQSRLREVRPGKVYKLPPRQDRVSPEGLSEEEWQEFLRSGSPRTPVHEHMADAFHGMSDHWARLVCWMASVEPEAPVGNLRPEESENLRIALAKSIEKISRGETLTGEPVQDFVRRVVADFTERAMEFELEEKRSELRSLVAKRKKKLEALAEALEEDLDDAEEREEYRKKADLLLANLHRVRPGMKEIEIEDWESGQTVEIELDPWIQPQELVEQLYQKYRKLKRTHEIAQDRRNKTEAEIEELDLLLDEIEAAENLDEIHTIRERLSLLGLLPDQSILPQEKKTSRDRTASGPAADVHVSAFRYRSNDGFLILAGRGELSNQELRRLSSPDDIWLHVRDYPGSHVYIVTRGRNVPETTIREAAMVAVWHSKARESSNVPVDYTRAKYVSAIPGAGPGKVSFKRERTIRVTAEPERIELMRLMAGGAET